MENLKKYIAECIGTCVLVTFGCGTAVAVGCSTPGGYLITALAFGLVIVAMAYSIGNISGCHINPAVSLAMFLRRKIDLNDLIWYVIAQCIGAAVGCIILGILFGFKCGFGANQVQLALGGSYIRGFIAEIILTFVFVLAIIGVTSKTDNNAVSGIVIGLTLTLVHILGIALTGTSVNPARSLMPAVFAVFSSTTPLMQVWIFILAPLAGGALAAILYNYLEKE